MTLTRHRWHVLATALIVAFLGYAANKDAQAGAGPSGRQELEAFLAGLLEGLT
jgi:hypothetical protein